MPKGDPLITNIYGITAYGSMKFGDAKVVAEASYIKNENDITSSQAALNQSVDTDITSCEKPRSVSGWQLLDTAPKPVVTAAAKSMPPSRSTLFAGGNCLIADSFCIVFALL